MTSPEPLEPEVVETTSAIAISAQDMAMIDVQVKTARAYPRSIQKFQSDLEAWACATTDIAEESFYVLRRQGKRIEGPSIRFAELLQCAYEHIFTDARVIEEGDRFVTVEATARDAQRNIAWRVQVRRRITTKEGRRYNDDMIQTTINAAISLASRNAIIRVIPKALWLPVFRKAKEVALGDAVSFAERRDSAFTWLGKAGAPEAHVLAYLGRAAVLDVTPQDVLDLRVIATSIKDGERDVDEVFPPPESKPDPKAAKEAAAAVDAALDGTKDDDPPESGFGTDGAKA